MSRSAIDQREDGRRSWVDIDLLVLRWRLTLAISIASPALCRRLATDASAIATHGVLVGKGVGAFVPADLKRGAAGVINHCRLWATRAYAATSPMMPGWTSRIEYIRAPPE
jgi:hypothetical protein